MGPESTPLAPAVWGKDVRALMAQCCDTVIIEGTLAESCGWEGAELVSYTTDHNHKCIYIPYIIY